MKPLTHLFGRPAFSSRRSRIIGGIAVGAVVVASVVLVLTLTLHAREVRHDHAAFQVIVLGTPVAFNDSHFDVHATHFEQAHLHTDETAAGETIHLEGPRDVAAPNVTVRAFFASLGIEASAGHVRLAPSQGNKSYDDDASNTWRLLVEAYGTHAFRREISWDAYVIRPCDRWVLAYGPPDADLADAEARLVVPELGTTYGRCDAQ